MARFPARQLSSRGARSAVLALLLSGCGLNPSRVPGSALFADDGGRVERDGALRFAVVGNTRGATAADKAPGRGRGGSEVARSIVADIAARADQLDFVAHLGDAVRRGTTREWRAFHALFAPLVDPAAGGTLRGVPVVGDHEALGDPRYRGWGAAWPSVGADIGYNRVASWYAFDVDSGGTDWRFLVLDTGRDHLGSRWKEQLAWIPRAVEDGRFDHIVVFMHDGLFDLGGSELAMNPGGAPGELLETLEDAVGMMRVRAVFFAGHATSQVMLPGGPLGELHVGAGGGGAPAEDLHRWGPADAAGLARDVQLEPRFDVALMRALDAYDREVQLPPVVLDEARAKGSFEGFTGTYDAANFPVQGWWQVAVLGPTLRVSFRHRLPDGAFEDRFRIWYDPGNGWAAR